MKLKGLTTASLEANVILGYPKELLFSAESIFDTDALVDDLKNKFDNRGMGRIAFLIDENECLLSKNQFASVSFIFL